MGAGGTERVGQDDVVALPDWPDWLRFPGNWIGTSAWKWVITISNLRTSTQGQWFWMKSDPWIHDPVTGNSALSLPQFQFRGDDVFKEIASLSGGERSKLALARIIYASPPLLALDEPTNHLDIASREALEPALGAYPGTLLFITHDRRLVERIATHILYVEDKRVRLFDRFKAFEEWLEEDVAASPRKRAQGRSEEQNLKKPPTPQLSKNRREQLEKEVQRLETKIGESENEIDTMESLFQESPKDLEWGSANQRYSELKVQVERLYQELAHKAALLE